MRKVSSPPPAFPAARAEEWVWSARLRGLTPIVRGGSQKGGIDEDRPVRGPSIRGQLRAWWRATQATTDLRALYAAEVALFGAVHGDLRASQVRVGVRDAESKGLTAPDPLGYGLWILRQSEGKQLHDAVRATVDVRAPATHQVELARALDAWLLCAGLGSRTRRGYGALWPEEWPGFADADAWAAKIAALAPPAGARKWASLAGVTCLTWDVTHGSAQKAVDEALDRFRQARGMASLPQRQFDGSKRFPPIQNEDWQNLKVGRGEVKWWPALGLPIQVRSSHDHFPGTREIKPRHASRLPSPILVRPIPLRSGQFAPGLIVLRLWSTPEVEVRGAGGMRGAVRQVALDGFVEFLEQKGARRLGGGR